MCFLLRRRERAACIPAGRRPRSPAWRKCSRVGPDCFPRRAWPARCRRLVQARRHRARPAPCCPARTHVLAAPDMRPGRFNGRAGTDNAFYGGEDEILFTHFAPSRRTDRLTPLRVANFPTMRAPSAICGEHYPLHALMPRGTKRRRAERFPRTMAAARKPQMQLCNTPADRCKH